jgi:hypothetical protein
MPISITHFRCVACGVTSGSPEGWTAIETHSTDGSPDGTTIIHLCPACRPMLRDLFAWLERGGAPRSTQPSVEPPRRGRGGVKRVSKRDA